MGIHPGRKMPAMTLHTKFVMVTWCQGALLNHLKLSHRRKILTCCAMARADGGLRGEQSFTVTCARERGWVHCVHKNWSRLNAKRHHDVSWNIFKVEKKFLFTHMRTHCMWKIESNLFLLIIVEKFTYFTPASSHQAAKAWQPGSHLDVDLTTEVGLK